MRNIIIISLLFIAASCGGSDTSAYKKQIERDFAECSARSDAGIDIEREYEACKKEKGLYYDDRF